MIRQSFETVAEALLTEGSYFTIHTSATRNLGLNGQEPVCFEVGQKDVRGDNNYYVETMFDIVDDNLLRLDINRTTWSSYDKLRQCRPTKVFTNTVFVEFENITHITKN